MAFYYEKTINAPMFNVLSVASEIQTYKDWVPLMYCSEFTHEPTLFRKLAHCGLTIPWPFSNREWHTEVIGTADTEDNGIILILKSIPGDIFMEDTFVQKNPKTVEIQINYLSIYIEVLNDNKHKIRFLMNLDPKFDKLPDMLINNFMKVVVVIYLKTIASKAEKLSDQYKKLIAEKPEFYAQIKQFTERFKLARILDFH